jgi:8-oxo-dGTP pyrophosphatase MutT (NUDIX family)
MLQSYNSIFAEENLHKTQMLDFLTNTKEPFSRQNKKGHFTASAFLLNTTASKFLLMHHRKLQKWLQPGGHCDGDSDVLSVAIKEAREESGINQIKSVTPNIFDLDVHLIPPSAKDPAHYHYDVRFLLQTVDNDCLVQNHESNKLEWVNFDDLQQFQISESVIRMITKFANFRL